MCCHITCWLNTNIVICVFIPSYSSSSRSFACSARSFVFAFAISLGIQCWYISFFHTPINTLERVVCSIFFYSLFRSMDAFVHSSIIRDSRSSFTLLLVLFLSLSFSHIFWIVCVYRIICHSFSALSVSVEGELNLYRFHIVYTVKLFGIYDFVHFFHFFS